MLKIAIFDADGVITKGEYVSIHLERDYGISKELTKTFFEGVFMETVIGKKDLKIVLVPYLKAWGWKKSVQEFLDYWHKSEHVIDTVLVDYIQDLRLKGIICCLATNQNKYRFSYMLKDMRFADLFDKQYASSLLGHRKPSIEFYKKIVDDLNIKNKNEVLFWDDTEENVMAAKEFGIQAEIYNSFEEFKKKMQHYLFNSSDN